MVFDFFPKVSNIFQNKVYYLYCKEMIENGEIGDLQYVYSNRLNLGKVRTEENVFWSLAPHDVSIFQYLINGLEFIML